MKPATSEISTNVERRALWGGVALWALFCAAAVCVRGVRWEETYERAQVLAGLVSYPAGHPLFRYAHNAFTVQYYLSALLLRLVPGPGFVCGFRDALFLAATVVPVFLLAALASRRAVYGHAAAAIVLAGALGAFATHYPFQAWPGKFTSGQIGMGFALLTVFLLAAGHWRAGYFLAGLMPAIHVGQTPLLLAFVALFAFDAWRRGDRRKLARALPWAAAGLVVPALLGLYIGVFGVPPPLEGAYYSSEDAHALWRHYTFHEDVHRAFPRFNPTFHGDIALCAMLVLGVGFLLRGAASGEQRRRDPLGWLFAYAALAAVAVWGVALVQAVLGEATPFLLVGWMPRRLPNHAAVILLVFALGIVSRPREGATGRVLLAAVLLFLAVRPALSYLLPEVVFERYANAPEGIVFGLTGAALGVLLGRPAKRRGPLLAVSVLALAALAVAHQFGAACAVLGLLATAGIPLLLETRERLVAWMTHDATLGALCVVVLGLLLAEQWRGREHLPATPFEQRLAAYLAEHAEPDAMLVTPHWTVNFQEKTGHPLLYTYETPQLMPYMRSLAPSIIKIRRDIYGIVPGVAWDYDLEAWRDRTREQWRTLAEQYDFAYVLAPNTVPLDLPPALTDADGTLYATR